MYGLHKPDMRNKANANIVRNAEMEKIMPENSNCSGASTCSKESCEGCPSNKKGNGNGIGKEPMNEFSHIKKVVGIVIGKGGVG